MLCAEPSCVVHVPGGHVSCVCINLAYDATPQVGLFRAMASYIGDSDVAKIEVPDRLLGSGSVLVGLHLSLSNVAHP